MGTSKLRKKKGSVIVCKVTQFPAFGSVGFGFRVDRSPLRKAVLKSYRMVLGFRARVCTSRCLKGFLSLRKNSANVGTRNLYKKRFCDRDQDHTIPSLLSMLGV